MASPRASCHSFTSASRLRSTKRCGRHQVSRLPVNLDLLSKYAHGQAIEIPDHLLSIPLVVLERSKTSELPQAQVVLVPTAHVSAQSANDAQKVIQALKPDAVVLEVCDERIDGVIERLKSYVGNSSSENVLVPRRVSVNGLPRRAPPGMPDESTILARLSTSIGGKVSRSMLKCDAEKLMLTGLFKSVKVRVLAREVDDNRRSVLQWRDGAFLEVPVSEVVFYVKPTDVELTSNIQFNWNACDCLPTSNRSKEEAEVQIVRRAGELVSARGAGENEVSEWESAALSGALLIATEECLKQGYLVSIQSNSDAITVCIDDEVTIGQQRYRGDSVSIDVQNNLFSLSRTLNVSLERKHGDSFSMKCLGIGLGLVESSVSNKVGVRDGEEIVSGLAAAFEAQTRAVYLADLEMSETFKLFDEAIVKDPSGKKRAAGRFLLKSLWSAIAVNFQSQAKVRDTIETERIALARGGDVKMPPYMREVFIERRNDELFQCLWNASVGSKCHKPCFVSVGPNVFEYVHGADARVEHDSECRTLVGVVGAAHVPGIIQRWDRACAEAECVVK